MGPRPVAVPSADMIGRKEARGACATADTEDRSNDAGRCLLLKGGEPVGGSTATKTIRDVRPFAASHLPPHHPVKTRS